MTWYSEAVARSGRACVESSHKALSSSTGRCTQPRRAKVRGCRISGRYCVLLLCGGRPRVILIRSTAWPPHKSHHETKKGWRGRGIRDAGDELHARASAGWGSKIPLTRFSDTMCSSVYCFCFEIFVFPPCHQIWSKTLWAVGRTAFVSKAEPSGCTRPPRHGMEIKRQASGMFNSGWGRRGCCC